MAILERIDSPRDLKNLSLEELTLLAKELRERMIEVVSHTGGHLASSLGVVELTIALHYVYNTPKDKLIWDVGHQAYAHKLLTGRGKVFDTLRTYGGISGFPKRAESEYDPFGTGHSSTSISAALGLAKARDLTRDDYKVVAVVGDGALTGGMAYEALDHAGHLQSDMLVILNDNEMSISQNIGALATHLSRIRLQPGFDKIRKDLRKFVRNIPGVGERLLKAAEKVEDKLAYLVVPGVLFEALGFTYLGPFDGHNLEYLLEVLEKAKNLNGPRLLHLITQKGRGYTPAEDNCVKFHGTAPFFIESGKERQCKSNVSFSKVAGDTLLELAAKDHKIVAISAAMPDGTGLREFADTFPERFFDVGIAEPHAVTFAAALACQGLHPVVAIYSTFMQRAIDQIIHDVCLQNLPVTFLLDRAGLVGEDGPTHHGAFDLSYLRYIPNLTLMAPKDEQELADMIYTASKLEGPSAIRYPRGSGTGMTPKSPKLLTPGKGETLQEGSDLAIIALGSMVYPALLAARELSALKLNARVINPRFVKPLDTELIIKAARECKVLVVAEENSRMGGLGSAVLETLAASGVKDTVVKILGLPDIFVEHGNLEQLREKYELSAPGIMKAARTAYQAFMEDNPLQAANHREF